MFDGWSSRSSLDDDGASIESAVFAPGRRPLDGIGPSRRRRRIRTAASSAPSTSPSPSDRPIRGMDTATANATATSPSPPMPATRMRAALMISVDAGRPPNASAEARACRPRFKSQSNTTCEPSLRSIIGAGESIPAHRVCPNESTGPGHRHGRRVWWTVHTSTDERFRREQVDRQCPRRVGR